MSEITREQRKNEGICFNDEFKHAQDDCESYYCELTGADWCLWLGDYDYCETCPYATDPEEYYRNKEFE